MFSSDYQYTDLLLSGVVTTNQGSWTYTYNSDNDLLTVRREGKKHFGLKHFQAKGKKVSSLLL